MVLNYTDKKIKGAVNADPSFFKSPTHDAKDKVTLVYAEDKNIIKAYEDLGIEVQGQKKRVK